MNESILLLLDYSNICRLCLQSTDAMSDLYTKTNENLLKDMVLLATGLTVDQNDGLPTKICHKCRYVVELSCDLKNMVEKTNTLLINASSCLDNMDNEQEKIPDVQFADANSVPNRNMLEKPNKRIMMQDAEMALVPTDHKSTDDQTPKNNKEWKHVQGSEDDIKVKERKVLPKQLTCQICLTTFPDEADVKSHVDLHYVNSKLTPYTKLQRPYKCEICRKRLNKSQLIHHHRTHLNVNPFVCKHAGCQFVGKKQDSLRRHLSTHAPRTQVCEHCGAAYKRLHELKLHMIRAHQSPTPSNCCICHKTFKSAVYLAKHVQEFHKPRRYKCEWSGCTKAYHTAHRLTAHSRTHTNERRFQCHLCPAAYTTQSLLNRFRYEAKLEKHLETCEQAMQNVYNTVPLKKKKEHLLAASIQDGHSYEDSDKEITKDLSDKFKRQSLVVQSGNISDLTKNLGLQDLQADGLLFIEEDSKTVHDAWQHLTAL